ncbi:AMP-binding protein [Undibacterium sp.]|jgi:long-chain acyl-CoA synthetase|uniref:AMP-binding protein n=1 Tax=Undibacterium sp. TaxID=1914977 RepID=UPI002BBDC798|nr:AMP-binding protein [Undibacterium sp.]HTD03603.1 AMP-binding protein [Undibacterium sp.]
MKPLHEHLRQHARTQPEKPAYIWYGRAVSYAELDRASDAFAARLDELGVKPGDPVALFMNNCPQYAMAHYGIQKLGAIVCPCGPLNKEHELEYQLNDLQARVIVAADNLLPIVDKVRGKTALQHVFAVRYTDLLPEQPSLALPAELQAMLDQPKETHPGAIDFLAAVHAGGESPQPELSMDDVALMTYTSGTTGLPKGAMLTYRNAVYKTAAGVGNSKIGKDDILLAVAPLYHIAGMVMGINCTIYTGATCVLLYRFDPLAVLQAIDQYRVSYWYSIAPMNVALMQVTTIRDFDLSSLRTNLVTSFGITFTETLATQWKQYVPQCGMSEASYGLSETHTVDTYMPLDAIRWGTQGKAIAGNEIRIIDPDTRKQCAPGEVGEIVLRSAGVFKGYWNKPEATAQTLRDGWVYTGDMGKLDADGYLTFIGRFKEMIKVSGYSVFPEEVESILIKHPAIAQAAVIGTPDADKGEVVKAFVVLKAGQGAESTKAAEIIAWSRENMASYKAPREVRFIEALPATGAGKVLRRLLRDY